MEGVDHYYVVSVMAQEQLFYAFFIFQNLKKIILNEAKLYVVKVKYVKEKVHSK